MRMIIERQAVASAMRKRLSRSDASARLALGVFVAVVALAFARYAVAGRRAWFFYDEWDFLADRNGGNLHDLFTPHYDHWSTLPILVYRLLWNVFGLRTYRPYQLLIIALHLTAAVLLRVVMRRAGVGPWIATVAAATFALLGGAGWMNILWGFQIGFVGSLVCGLVQLILADHDGPIDWRDALGLTFGIAGLMCSGFAVTMTLVVGLAVLIRRGWRPATFYTVPAAMLYLAWWVAFARNASTATPGSLSNVAEYVSIGVSNGFARLGHWPGIGLALALVLVGGLALAWGRLPLAQLRRQAAVPAALLVGCPVFFAIVGFGKGGPPHSPHDATFSRYVHLAAALTLPALAVAADAIARRWRFAAPLLIVLFLLGVPSNMATIFPREALRTGLGRPELVLSLGQVPLAQKVPGDVHPIPSVFDERYITVGWLREGVKSGRIPRLAYIAPNMVAEADLRVALVQRGQPWPSGPCKPFTARTQRIEAGQHIDFVGKLLVRLVGDGGGVSSAKSFWSGLGSRLAAVGGPLTIDIAPNPGAEAFECR
jgi:hypothetical protein